jgi:hypothetical protein
MGYPTDPVGRTKLLERKLPLNTPPGDEPLFNAWSNQLSPDFYMDKHLQSVLCSLPENQVPLQQTNAWEPEYKMNSPGFGPNLDHPSISEGRHTGREQSNLVSPSLNQSASGSLDAHTLQSSPETDVPPSFWSSPGESGTSHNLDEAMNVFEQTDLLQDFDMELNGGAYFGINTDSDDQQSALPVGLQSTKGLSLWESGKDAAWGSLPTNRPRTEDQFDSASLYEEAIESFQRKSRPNSVKIPFRSLSNSSSTAGTRSKIRSLFKPKSSASSLSSGSRKRYATSQFTYNTDDSGYATGHTSCLTLDQVRQINIQSLKEFNGLYRVACHILHEPQSKAQCKDISTCTYCRYSSIHNLAWSARYLKLEVFLSELKLQGVYDFCALDAAGNSALHYAAAGGAGYQHLKALIDVGVDPYIANTAGELFIYCLRPIEPFTLEPNSDCLKSDDLIRLLKLLDHDRVFDWRDNDGQTIMHALALKITEPELKAKIFKYA